MLNSSTIFEINEEEFLLTLLDSGEIRSRTFFYLRGFGGRNWRLSNCTSINRAKIALSKLHQDIYCSA